MPGPGSACEGLPIRWPNMTWLILNWTIDASDRHNSITACSVGLRRKSAIQWPFVGQRHRFMAKRKGCRRLSAICVSGACSIAALGVILGSLH
jgi:hypothetical protein